jgi:hypothetical protein
MRDSLQEPASYLNPPDKAKAFTILAGEQHLHHGALAAAIACVQGGQDGVEHKAVVQFQVGADLREVFVERRVLLQFLEAFA